MISRITLLFFFIWFCLLSTGCSFSIKTNVPNNSEYWGHYEYDKEYTFIADVLLVKTNNYYFVVPLARLTTDKHILRPKCKGVINLPYDENYECCDPGTKYADFVNNDNIVGTVKKGTIIKINPPVKEYHWNIWYGYMEFLHEPKATIVDGQFAGILASISSITYKYYLTKPDYNKHKNYTGIIIRAYGPCQEYLKKIE